MLFVVAAGARAQGADPLGQGPPPPAWRADAPDSATAPTDPPPPPRPRWAEADRRLVELKRDFEQSAAQREKLLNDLTTERRGYQPGKLDPSGVIAYKAIDRILGQLHLVIERGRRDAEEAGRILMMAMATRNLWEPRLRQEVTQNKDMQQEALTPAERERRQLWLGALGRLDAEGDEGFARAMLGDGFGPMALEAAPEPGERPLIAGGPFGRRGRGGGPLMRQMAETIRQRWLDRLTRMEQRQEELAQELQRQQREIERMRHLLTNAKGDEPPTAGAPSPAKQPSRPPQPNAQ